MAQVIVRLPEDVLEAARQRAREQHRCLSAWVSELIRRDSVAGWPDSLEQLLRDGSADLVEPDDPPPEGPVRLVTRNRDETHASPATK